MLIARTRACKVDRQSDIDITVDPDLRATEIEIRIEIEIEIGSLDLGADRGEEDLVQETEVVIENAMTVEIG